MNFDRDIVIGLEIHVELKTKTKIFCRCPMRGSEEPNTRTCPTCLGFPGSKPVLNRQAVEFGLRMALALECEIAPELVFSRKSYFYPDLAKNYQISQYELPLAKNGFLKLKNGKKIGITRAHLEEDPASLVHPSGMQDSAYVLVDYNRSGTPLLEIVTEPDMESPAQARDFMKQLITVLSYIGIFDENDGVIKADANVSVKETNYTRVEVKNITGFKEIERALLFEIARQKENVSEVCLETRGWDSEKGISFSMRKKESEADYGYIVDPDLTATIIDSDWIDRVREELPELADEKISKFEDLGVKKEDAHIVAQDRELAELYERVSKEIDPVLAIKWIRRELVRVLNYAKTTLKETSVDEKTLITILKLVSEKKITDTTGQKLMEKLVKGAFDVEAYVEKEGLLAVSDKGELEVYCKEALEQAPEAVEDFKKGNDKALNYVVGLVMKKTKGSASPQEVQELLRSLIKV